MATEWKAGSPSLGLSGGQVCPGSDTFRESQVRARLGGAVLLCCDRLPPQIAKDVKQFYDQALQQAIMDDDANNAKAVVKTFHETVRGAGGRWGGRPRGLGFCPLGETSARSGRGIGTWGDSEGPGGPWWELDEPRQMGCRGLCAAQLSGRRGGVGPLGSVLPLEGTRPAPRPHAWPAQLPGPL